MILAFQTARFLMKSVRQVRAKQPLTGSVQYLHDADLAPCNPAALGPKAPAGEVRELALSLLRDRARRFAEKLETAFAAHTANGANFDQALGKCQVLAFKAAECHTVYILARNHLDVMTTLPPAGPLREASLRLYELMALQQIYEHAGDFLGLLSDVDPLLERINQLLEDIRPDAVALTDGWGIPDSTLKSTLGRYDGNVYEAIYEEARRVPLNQNPKMAGWHHLAEVLDLDFIRDGMKEQRQGLTAAPRANL